MRSPFVESISESLIVVHACRMTLLCSSWVSVMRVASVCRGMWEQLQNTTNELPKQATSRPSSCWCLQMPKIVRVVVLLSVMSRCVVSMINMDFSFFSPAKDTVLRSISSAPCFAGSHLQQPLSSRLTPSAFNLPLLPHSWSTGSLCVPPLSSSLLPLHPLNTEGGTCQWTVGLGWARRIHLLKRLEMIVNKSFFCLLGLSVALDLSKWYKAETIMLCFSVELLESRCLWMVEHF